LERIEEVDPIAKLREWRQGDIFQLTSFAYMSNLEAPSTPAAEEVAAKEDREKSSALQFVVEGIAQVVVLSQTCDLVDPPAANPFVEVAVAIHLEGEEATRARSVGTSGYVHIPEVNLFADLYRTMTIEKSVLLSASRTAGLGSDKQRRRFAWEIGRHRQRPALPDDFRPIMKPLQNRVQRKYGQPTFDAKGKNPTKEGVALEALQEIRVSAAPSWSSDAIDLRLFFITESQEIGLGIMNKEDWQRQVDQWLTGCNDALAGTRYQSVSGEWTSWDDLTINEYFETDRLDFDRLSPEGGHSEEPQAAPA
jgi:hypothetical protein